MKRLLLMLLCLPIITLAQTKDEQIVVEYSLKYRIPSSNGIMGPIIKFNTVLLPDLCTMYFSSNFCRIELDHTRFSIFGERNVEGLIIKDYNKSELFLKSKVKDFINVYLDLKKNTGRLLKSKWLYDEYELFVDTTTSLTYLNETKEIKLNISGSELIKEAIKFNYENDTEIVTGYIMKDIPAIGALVEGQDYGLPISYAKFNKKTNLTATYKLIAFRIEDIDNNLYKSSIWKY